MIKMLILRLAPLLAGQRAEKSMDIAVQAAFTRIVKLVDQFAETRTRRFKVRLVVNFIIGAGRAVWFERLLA